MKILVCIFLCSTAICSAQQETPSNHIEADAAIKAIRPDAIRAHTRFLSDSLLEGRAPGTPGYDIAAKYVAAQLEALSLQPAGAQGTWFQTVPMRKSINIGVKSSLKLLGNGKELALKDPEDFVFFEDLSRTESDVEAPVVFVGYGVTAPELNYDDYSGVDVRGKIVAYLTTAPRRFSPSMRGFYSDGTMKGKNAVAHGAVGILAFRDPDDEKRYPWEWTFPLIQMGSSAWMDRKGQPKDALPEIRGSAMLSHEGAELLFANAPRKLEEVFAAADVSRPQAFPLAWTAKLHTESSHSAVVSSNIAGKIMGSDPVLRNEFVVYTGHVDHLGICPPVNGDNVCHGALDNAAGVGTLLEIARAYTTLPRPARRSILFLFVTGEEDDLEGSDYFVYFPTEPKVSIVANINIDGAPGMMFSPSKITAIGGEHSSLGQSAERATLRIGYEFTPDTRPDENLFVHSDQFSFVKAGIPAVWVRNGGTVPDEVKKVYAGHYHSPLDNMDQPIGFEAGAKAARMIFLLGYDVAQQDQRPKWNDNDFFGRMFSPAQ